MQMLLLLKVELLVSARLFAYVFFCMCFFFSVQWNYFSKKKEKGQKINFYYPAATDNDYK